MTGYGLVGLARFFGKSAISAASLLRHFDQAEFRRSLTTSVVGVAYDAEAASSPEGQLTLELLVDLLARLYPTLAIGALGTNTQTHSRLRTQLAGRARAINPEIVLGTELEEATVMAVVGATPVQHSGAVPAPVVYVGSDGWLAKASAQRPVRSGTSRNPFGAGAAACMAAAAIFRAIFAEALEQSASTASGALSAEGPEVDVSLSLLDWSVGPATRGASPSLPYAIDIGESFLVGVGAIGSAAVWALARTPGIHGILHLVDDEIVELSNLQRYVLTSEASIGEPKVDLAVSDLLSRPDLGASPELDVRLHRQQWQEYVANRGDYRFDRVVLALDSAEDRIAVQSSLPRWVANAWTQPENLGVSRHPSFASDACVACLYLPTQVRKSRDALYAEALGVQQQDEIMEIRRLLHSGAPVGDQFLRRTAERLGVPPEPLAEYADRPLEQFYTEALCGGVVLNLGGRVGTERRTEVPMAFQSALAGIALAAELVIQANGLREVPLPCRSEIDLLRPLGSRLNSPVAKHPSGRCICQDAAYQAAYAAKYLTGPAASGGADSRVVARTLE